MIPEAGDNDVLFRGLFVRYGVGKATAETLLRTDASVYEKAVFSCGYADIPQQGPDRNAIGRKGRTLLRTTDMSSPAGSGLRGGAITASYIRQGHVFPRLPVCFFMEVLSERDAFNPGGWL